MVDKLISMVRWLVGLKLPANKTKIFRRGADSTEERLLIKGNKGRLGLIIELITPSALPVTAYIILTNDDGNTNGTLGQRHTFRLINDGDVYVSDPIGREYQGDVYVRWASADTNTFLCVTELFREELQ